jgi:hypothetical protein
MNRLIGFILAGLFATGPGLAAQLTMTAKNVSFSFFQVPPKLPQPNTVITGKADLVNTFGAALGNADATGTVADVATGGAALSGTAALHLADGDITLSYAAKYVLTPTPGFKPFPVKVTGGTGKYGSASGDGQVIPAAVPSQYTLVLNLK